MPSKFKVIGPLAIAGVSKGGTISLEALEAAGGSVQVLVDGGHIVPVVASKAPSDSAEAEPKAPKAVTKKEV